MLCCVKQKESPTKDTKKDSQENLVAASNNNKKPPSKEKQKSSPVHVNKAFDDNVKPKEKSGPQSGKDKSASRDASPDQVVIEGFQSQEEFDPKMATELAGLLNRLEVVTSRLESVASKGGGGAPAAPGAPGKWRVISDGLEQDCGISSIIAMDISPSCTKLSITSEL